MNLLVGQERRLPSFGSGSDYGSAAPQAAGEALHEPGLEKNGLLSPALSSFLRQEEREKRSEIGRFSTCIDANDGGERAPKAGEGLVHGPDVRQMAGGGLPDRKRT